jgi:type II secretion system protein H
MRFSQKQRPGGRGFTLIELMVVIIIIGIVSALIVAEMHGTVQDALLRSTGRELIGACNAASSRAVATNRPHRIRLDPALHRYFLERSARGGLDFFPVRGVPDSEGSLDPRIAFAVREPPPDGRDNAGQEPHAKSADENDAPPPGANEAVCFYPDGTADSREIELRDQDGFRLALLLNPVTSRVEVIESGRE